MHRNAWVLTHARGNFIYLFIYFIYFILFATLITKNIGKEEEESARDAVKVEQSPNSWEDDTRSWRSESSDSDDSSTRVEESIGVMLVPEEEIQQVN